MLHAAPLGMELRPAAETGPCRALVRRCVAGEDHAFRALGLTQGHQSRSRCFLVYRVGPRRRPPHLPPVLSTLDGDHEFLGLRGFGVDTSTPGPAADATTTIAVIEALLQTGGDAWDL